MNDVGVLTSTMYELANSMRPCISTRACSGSPIGPRPPFDFQEFLALQLWPSSAALQRHLTDREAAAYLIQVSSIMSLSAAAALRQRSDISEKEVPVPGEPGAK